MDLQSSKKYDELSHRLSVMEGKRSSWESLWQRIAELADPKNATFTVERGAGDIDKGQKKTDSTLALTVPKWANAMDGLTTPKTQKWHGLTITDSDLADKYRDYFEQCRDVLFSIRYGAGSNFSSANNENLKMIGFYGNGPFSVTENYGRGINYKAWPVQEFYVEQNHLGDIDVFFRKFTLTTRQALQEFKEATPADIKKCDKLDKEWQFLMAVYPNTDYTPGRFDGPKKKYACDYLCLSTKEIVMQSGFDVCPFCYPRYDVLPNLQDPYGYSPTMLLLPEIKKLASMGRSNLRVAGRASDPTYLMSDEDIIGVDRVGMPNALIPGGLDGNGRPRVQALQNPGQLPFSLEMLQDMRQLIREGFDMNLFATMINKPDMTATEVLQRQQETAVLVGPTTSRREREFLSHVIAKEFEIAMRAGQLPPMPPELVEALSAGQAEFQIEYESPIRRAQEADSGTAIMRTLEVAGALAPFDPSIKNQINAGRVLKEVAKVFGAPSKIFNTDEEKEALDANDAQMAQAQQMLEAAPVMSQSAKDLAAAQAATGTELR